MKHFFILYCIKIKTFLDEVLKLHTKAYKLYWNVPFKMQQFHKTKLSILFKNVGENFKFISCNIKFGIILPPLFNISKLL